MASSRDVTIAFAGSGQSSLNNIKALLGDLLDFGPENDEGYPEIPKGLSLHILLPVSESHVTESIMSVFEWTEYAGVKYDVRVSDETDAERRKTRDVKDLLEYADDKLIVTNVNSAIIDYLADARDEGDEAYLLLFWDDDDANTEILLDLAGTAEIKTKDMTAGLDDLSFEVETSEAPEPEPEPEPEPAPEEKPRRGRARRNLQEERKPLEDKPEPESGPIEDIKRGRVRGPVKAVDLKVEVSEKDLKQNEPDIQSEVAAAARQALVKAGREMDVQEALSTISSIALFFEKVDESNAMIEMADVRYRPMTIAARRAFNVLAESLRPGSEPAQTAQEAAQEAPAEPRRGRGRPRADGSPAQPRTASEKAVMEILNEDSGEWEPKGRGRAPKGAKTRLVDPVTREVVSE